MYERLIGLTKNMLKRCLGTGICTLKELRTLIIEVECRLNNRPLTYVSNDLGDPIPISPSQLLCGHRTDTVPTAMDDEEFLDRDYVEYGQAAAIRRQLRETQTKLENFWKRWLNEYLTSLRERTMNVKGSQSNVKVGDVVLIEDDIPRVQWKMAVISDLHVGRDGQIRSVKLRTTKGYVTRPILKLYPLELSCEENETVQESGQRPLRAAAAKARKAIFEMMQ